MTINFGPDPRMNMLPQALYEECKTHYQDCDSCPGHMMIENFGEIFCEEKKGGNNA